MEKHKRYEKPFMGIARIMAIATTATSLLAPVVYLIWYAATIDKRVTLIEQNENDFESDISDVKNEIHRSNDRIEQIYQIFLEQKINGSVKTR
jgi:predicted PurR-regulated permease PerM